VNVSHVLGEEHVGLEEVGDGIWDVYFGPLRLGQMDERTRKIEDALGRRVRKRVVQHTRNNTLRHDRHFDGEKFFVMED
jgi:hypothetical protein